MNKIGNTLLTLGANLVSNKLAHLASNIELEDVLQSMGLSRRRRHWPKNLAFVGAGVLIGGVAALVLAPQSGKEFRARLVSKRSGLGDATSEASTAAKRDSGGSDHQVSNRDESTNGGTATTEVLSHEQSA